MKKWIAIILVMIFVLALFVKTRPVFETDNVSRITFYAYYGNGVGSEVSAEHMTEFIDWLDSFRAGRMLVGLTPPGTNTVYVEIVYSDGEIIKQGLDTVEFGWMVFYTNSHEPPDCFDDILSKTSLGQ